MQLSQIKKRLVSFLFQPCCCICDQHLDVDSSTSLIAGSESQICDDCFAAVTGTLIDRCYFCGAVFTTNNPFGLRCCHCRSWTIGIERAIAIGNYGDALRDTVLEVKRDLNDIKAFQLGEIIGELFEKFDLPHEIDRVVPVPSHWWRKISRRGLHIPDVIADGFCRVTGFTKSTRALKCIRYVKKQATLSRGQRKDNVRGVFVAQRGIVPPDSQILLIDDVMTSGATIGECARVLRAAGAVKVYAAVAARGIGIG